MKKAAITLLFLSCILTASGQADLPEAYAVRTGDNIRVDGRLNEAGWEQAKVIREFRQYIPSFGIAVSFPTELRILYDDRAIYIGARMFDPFPDSILRQLGNRDDEHLNADYFAVGFDTYNNQLDAYYFLVHASGVQNDGRMEDDTYDAVWESAVSTDEKGWTAEMKIPYSAIRFPAVEKQTWGFQAVRSIRRYREESQWALIPKGVPTELVHWGRLQGLEHISPPLRLSVTPYLSASLENAPSGEDGGNGNSTSFSGGMDLKYGLNESFTLDVTLLPDFSQVQSDNKIKNLTAFETIYDEQRPFFMEATDLFERGDLFYSRRIGRTPLLFYEAEARLQAGEQLVKNPPVAKLINATKFSGRGKKGLAIGLLNALTDNTYATISDSLGSESKFLTDPRTNYNIIVVDQALKNNSSFYLINTNVVRDKGFQNANVTGSGLTLFNKKNTLKLDASGALSQLYDKEGMPAGTFTTSLGYKYKVALSKEKGRLQYGASHQGMDDHFSANDLGVTLYNNVIYNSVFISWYQFEPHGIIRDMQTSLGYNDQLRFSDGKTASRNLSFGTFGNFTNYLTFWANVTSELQAGYDFYEARIPGRIYLKPRYSWGNIGLSSDYRKTLAIDGWIEYTADDRDDFSRYDFTFKPLVRASDHLFFEYNLNYMHMFNDIGFAAFDNEAGCIFGNREVKEVTNTLSGRYIIKNNLALNLRLRHYWSTGVYDKFYVLNEDGTLTGEPFLHPEADFNFNSFNLDLVFFWEFAPGSRLNLIWKNAILDESKEVNNDFIRNFRDTWDLPQTNTFTIKFLYYIDYQNIFKNKPKKIL